MFVSDLVNTLVAVFDDIQFAKLSHISARMIIRAKIERARYPACCSVEVCTISRTALPIRLIGFISSSLLLEECPHNRGQLLPMPVAAGKCRCNADLLTLSRAKT